ncbi:hypothetical protein BC831DRAFT_294800 [Entophlyctis helioformis]|nr:hypothetical protein BC831DRAFT_294800 [Entophlyctis helioformis]
MRMKRTSTVTTKRRKRTRRRKTTRTTTARRASASRIPTGTLATMRCSALAPWSIPRSCRRTPAAIAASTARHRWSSAWAAPSGSATRAATRRAAAAARISSRIWCVPATRRCCCTQSRRWARPCSSATTAAAATCFCWVSSRQSRTRSWCSCAAVCKHPKQQRRQLEPVAVAAAHRQPLVPAVAHQGAD